METVVTSELWKKTEVLADARSLKTADGTTLLHMATQKHAELPLHSYGWCKALLESGMDVSSADTSG